MVIKKLSPSEESEDVSTETALKEMLPKIKEAAITYKKSFTSETDHWNFGGNIDIYFVW